MKKIGRNAVIPDNCVIYDDVEIHDNVVLHNHVVIYPGTIVESGGEIFDNCVLGKLPLAPGCTAKKYDGIYKKTVIEKDCIICPGVVIYTGTIIKENTLIGDNSSIREDCQIGSYNVIGRNVTVNYETVIGNRTKIMDGTHITGNMYIGNHVFISVLVSSTNDNSMGRETEAVNNLKGPYISDYVTIGAGASILPGVKIGENCIIGAMALVTRDVAANKVVMGVPARVVRDVEM